MRLFFAISFLFFNSVYAFGRSHDLDPKSDFQSQQQIDQTNVLIAYALAKDDYKQSVILFKNGQFAEAISSFGRVISNNSVSPGLRNKALIGRSQAFLIINQPTLAVIDLKKIRYQASEKNLIGNKEMILGVAFIQLKQYPLAIKHLSEALTNLPNEGSVYANRSVAYQALGNYKAAASDIEKALEINPTPSAVFNLAVLQKELKNYSRCYYLLSQLVNQKAAYADVYLQRGLCSKALNKPQQALEDFLRASSIDKSKAEAIENVGLMLSAMGQNSTALKYLEAASTMYLEQGRISKFESVSLHIDRLTDQ